MAIINDTGDGNVLIGAPGEENQIAGNGGDDTIIGRGKADLLLGGPGSDIVFGANGNDTLFGGSGDDTIKGGNGADRLQGDKGEDDLYGGNGDDTFALNANLVGQSFDTIHDFDVNRALRSMNFNDTLEIFNVSGQSFVFEQSDEDTNVFIDGVLVATLLEVNADDVLRATEFVGGSPKSVTLLDADGNSVPLTISGTSEDDVLNGQKGISNIIAGNSGDDIINGQGKDDTLLGGPGDDTLNGRNGSDTLFGGGDDDTLIGGNGGDTLSGDKGIDTLTGGNGADNFVFKKNLVGQSLDTVTDYDSAEGDVLVLNGFVDPITAVDDGFGNAVLSYDGTDFAVIEGVDYTTLQADYGFV